MTKMKFLFNSHSLEWLVLTIVKRDLGLNFDHLRRNVNNFSENPDIFFVDIFGLGQSTQFWKAWGVAVLDSLVLPLKICTSGNLR